MRLDEKKQDMGYRKDGPNCANCKHFRSEWQDVQREWMRIPIREEKNIRCGLENFATKKKSWCKKHEFKVEA